jgi:molybdopterin molybdotransferase
VGDYDFTRRVAEACGVQTIFHKVRQRPGKPLYFGKAGEKIFFGLPGNPASVLSCFYQYVTIALERLTGRSYALDGAEAVLEEDYPKPVGMTHFMRGRLDAGRVKLLAGQESFKMEAFAGANAYVELPEGQDLIRAGSVVKVWCWE